MGDDATLGEKMNRGMGLDPGFTLDHPNLVEAIRDMSDDTAKRAQKNLDQQRQNQADVEAIAAEMAAGGLTAGHEPPATVPPEPEHLPGMDVPHLHEYRTQDGADRA